MARRTWKRRLGRALALLVLVVFALGGAAVWRWTRFPATSGTLLGAGLERPIEILRGPYGVPHIIAANPRDAYWGLGFCEAQDRALQIEMFRRAASGRLAEVIGADMLPLDELARTVGFRRIAARQLENASPQALALTRSFTDGINAGLKSLKYKPPEFALLGIDPEPWTPLDCIAIARLVSWGLAGDFHTEVLFEKIARRIGPERARLLLPTATRTAGVEQAMAPAPAASALLARGDELLLGLGVATGCSNWIVSGARSASGKPLLAYDSHQGGARIPGEVYLAHMVGGADLDVMGGMIVGLPGVYAGASRAIAFAPTNLGADAQDLVEVAVDPAHPDVYEAAWKRLPFSIREESIAVKGRADPVRLTVRETVLGPI
ncbi:MAG: penicillin acylase family protein, partial [Polyangiaceae bacterium]